MIKPPPEAVDPARAALTPLDGAGWRAMHDVAWPGRDGATIDHVVVGPPGVFVIDRARTSRERALIHLGAATVAVMRFHPRVPTFPVLCVLEGELEEGQVREALLCAPEDLRGVLESQPPRLSASDVIDVARRLEDEFSGRTDRFEALPRNRRPKWHRAGGRARLRRPGPGRAPTGPIGVLIAGLFLVISLGISIVNDRADADSAPPSDGVSQRLGR